MWERLLETLRCPRCAQPLGLCETTRDKGEVLEGTLHCPSCGAKNPIVNGIPRFVPTENYASSFGFEWERFAEVQTDRLHGNRLSHERFYRELGCLPDDLRGLRVLEAGCGGGRFSEIALDAGAEVFAVDLSSAVDKSRAIRMGHPRLHLIQASILDMPLARESFDLVFCFGVLQHTPDPAETFRSLVPFVKPRGRLAVDIYAAHPKQSLHWKYLVRPVTKRLPRERLLDVIERAAPVLVPVSRRLRRIPRLGKALSRLVPIFVHDGFMGRVSPEEEVRWAILETFDALTPAYDRPRSRHTLLRWFRDAGFTSIETGCMQNALNYGRAQRPE